MIDVLKMDCCDFCFDEKHYCKRESKNVKAGKWQFKMAHKTLKVCDEHMNELLDCLKDLKGRGEI